MLKKTIRATNRQRRSVALFFFTVGWLLYSPPNVAQDQEVLTFKGEKGSSIEILNEKGEVIEKVNKDQLKKIVVKQRYSYKTEPNQPQTTANSTPKKANSDPSITKLLNERRKKLRRSSAYANRPPRKRK